jgi:hypothetical protein
MANPTTNFGWVMPTSTDLVTDLPADFAVFGQAVDTSMADLKGGTTGQVLAKASNTDMDFVWSADAAGMTNPMTTTGDTIYSSSGSTPARRAIGTTGQVLTVSGGLPTWATPAAAGGKTLLSTTALSGTSTTVSSISASYTDLYVYVLAAPATGNTVSFTFNSYSGWYGYYLRGGNSGTPAVSDTNGTSTINSINNFDNSDGGAFDVFVPQYKTSGAGKYKMAQYNFLNSNGTTLSGVAWAGAGSPTAAITSFTVSSAASLTGTILVYGIS